MNIFRVGLYGVVTIALGVALAALLFDGSLLLNYPVIALSLPTWSEAVYILLPLAAVVLAWPWADEMRNLSRGGLNAVRRLKRDLAMAVTQHHSVVPRQQSSYGPIWA